MTCHQIAESSRMPEEIADHGNDSPGGSLKLPNLSGGSVAERACADSGVGVRRAHRMEDAGVEVVPPFAQNSLPDPWLFDSDALIRELDRIRETALQVPTNGDANATHFGLQMVVNAAWTLRENLRYLLSLHREGQRSFRKQHEQREQSIKGADQQHQTIYALSTWGLISCW